MTADRIKDLDNCERPREKIIGNGTTHLTDVELLAVILRTGGKGKSALKLARDLLNRYGNFQNLSGTEVEELIRFENIGKAKATTIKAALEISKRLLYPINATNTKIRSPEDIFRIVAKELCFDTVEKLLLISIDSRGRLIAKDVLTTGTLNETIINSREIYQKALARNACSIIIAHNHPSGDIAASQEDIEVTKSVYETGKLIGVPLLDHLIVGKNQYTSLKQLGVFNQIKKGGEKYEKE
jgi:DNA repair protein RadC